ncbi:PAS domain-containing protein [bacterium]|nr:PAS domain-containing protein [bacterium]
MTAMDTGQLLSFPYEMFEKLDVGCLVIGPDRKIRRINGPLQDLGLSTGKTVGLTAENALAPWVEAPNAAKVIFDAVESAFQGQVISLGEDMQAVFAEPLDRPQRLAFIPLGATAGEAMVAIVFLDDSESRGVRGRFARILDSAPDGVMVIDANRRVRVFNRACGELLGRDPRDVVRSNCECSDVIGCHTEHGVSYATMLCPARALFRGLVNHQTEEMLCGNARGEERWIETTYSPVRGREGEIEYVIGIIRDVHERKILEERLHQTEKLASLGQLTAGIAHEIKNPLGIILSSVEVILDEKRPENMRKEAAQFIKEEVQRLDSRIRSFLSFARPQPIHSEPVVLNGVIRRSVGAFALAEGAIDVELDLECPEVIVQADPDLIHQVLTNLLLNAAESIRGPGRIAVRTRTEGDFVLIHIDDDGPGVPEEDRHRIFDPFYTTKAEGTGLGLSIVYQLVSEHRGTINVSTSPFDGARFTIRLPLRLPAQFT